MDKELLRTAWKIEAELATHCWSIVLDTIHGVDEHGPVAYLDDEGHETLLSLEAKATNHLDMAALIAKQGRET